MYYWILSILCGYKLFTKMYQNQTKMTMGFEYACYFRYYHSEIFQN